MLLNNIHDVPNWIIETRNINVDGNSRILYSFESNFRSTPSVTLSACSSSGQPLGNANVHIVSVNKNEIDISISANIPGMQIQMHAIGK